MSNMNDELGDRMKSYENPEAQARFLPRIPVVARIDGRSFSKFTKGMDRPYDKRMTDAMIATTVHLVTHTSALIGYTQSDEISLIFHSDDPRSQLWFDGRKQKMVSQLAAQATLAFFREVQRTMPEYADRMPSFDARVFSVPSKEEAVNALVWREWDATKNSSQMAASALYPHRQLMGKGHGERLDMMRAKGVNWNDYPAAFKRGTYVKRELVDRTPENLADLPPMHHARTNPDMRVMRSRIAPVEVRPITKITNRVAWVFDHAAPEYAEAK